MEKTISELEIITPMDEDDILICRGTDGQKAYKRAKFSNFAKASDVNSKLSKTGGTISGNLTVASTLKSKVPVYKDANEYFLDSSHSPYSPSRIKNFDNDATSLPATARNDKEFRAYVQAPIIGGKTYIAVMRFTVLEFQSGIMRLTRLFSHTDGRDRFDDQDQVLIENVIPGITVGETYTVAYERYLPDDTDVTRIGFAIKNSSWGNDPTCKIRVESMKVYPAASIGTATLTSHAVVTLSGVYSEASALFDGVKTNAVTRDGLICGNPGSGATFNVITSDYMTYADMKAALDTLEARVAALEARG